jgi:hypothetical protein
MESAIINIHGYEVLLSACDAEKVGKLKWHISKRNPCVYFRHTGKKDKAILLHRFILNAPPGIIVDHANGNTLDNRRENLRLCTIFENNSNRRKGKNTSSKYKGVSFHACNKKWQSQIKVNGCCIWLGDFDSEEDARDAYCNASKKYHGEFGRTE